MKRRDFIKGTAASTALLGVSGLSLSSFNSLTTKQLTILHTNDVHSHIDSFPANHPKYANMGGIAKRATLIETIKKENPNVVLLDAGDSFQGTPYFNYYGGELEFKLMSMLGYDATTIGNHEFDNGVEGLAAQIPNAKFDILNANYDFSNTIMHGLTKPYKIIVKDGIKIGIFGLGVELEGLVDKKMYKETVYLDPVEIATDVAKKLKHVEKCDLIICLSHLGYTYSSEPNKVSDIKLAAATQDIDLIIGGHTHTFLEKPTILENKIGKKIIVNQVGCYGINLGRIDFFFDSNKKIQSEGISISI
jgi:5'-nucleotidase